MADFELKFIFPYLVQAADNTSAISHIKKQLDGGMCVFSVHTVTKTRIIDYLDFLEAAAE